jgi:hypothetical protein
MAPLVVQDESLRIPAFGMIRVWTGMAEMRTLKLLIEVTEVTELPRGRSCLSRGGPLSGACLKDGMNGERLPGNQKSRRFSLVPAFTSV